MLPLDCGTPKTFTGVPFTRCAATLLSPAAVVRSCGLMVTMLLVLSTWKTRVAEPGVLLALIVTWFVPLGTTMVKLPPFVFVTQFAATVPRGIGVGASTVPATDQPLAWAGSFQTA